MSARKGPIIGSVILIVLGIILLLRNFIPDFRPLALILRYWPNFWLFFAKYWPLILILWGIQKLYCYFAASDDPSRRRKSLLSSGDIVLLIFLLLFGTAVTSFTKVLKNGVWPSLGEELNVHVGEGDLDLFGAETRFEFEEEVSQPVEMPKDTHTTLSITNKYGGVDVFSHNQPEIRVKLKKKIAAGDEAAAKEVASALKIVLEKTASGYALSSSRDKLDSGSRRGLKTDFSIWVPQFASVEVNNSYGPVNLQGISGDQEINNAYGPVMIKDIEGGIQVVSKYAAVTAVNISGNCQIVNKYGPIELNTIGGKTDVENAYGLITLNKIKGPVSVSNRFSDVSCEGLESALSVDARHASVQATNIGGDVQVETSYKNVKLENVLGAIRVQEKHGDIEIRNQHPPMNPISIDAEYSEIVMTLPRESHFEIDASTKYGKFVSDFRSTEVKESTSGTVSRLRGSYGGGGPTFTLVTSYHDIRLNPS